MSRAEHGLPGRPYFQDPRAGDDACLGDHEGL
jgi:hypothetical protein